jgi:hypothetical protein
VAFENIELALPLSMSSRAVVEVHVIAEHLHLVSHGVARPYFVLHLGRHSWALWEARVHRTVRQVDAISLCGEHHVNAACVTGRLVERSRSSGLEVPGIFANMDTHDGAEREVPDPGTATGVCREEGEGQGFAIFGANALQAGARGLGDREAQILHELEDDGDGNS